MGKFGSQSSSSSESTTTSPDDDDAKPQANSPSKEQQWARAGPNKTVNSGTANSEWKSVDVSANSSPRRRKKLSVDDGADDERSKSPSKASTDVSSSSSGSSTTTGSSKKTPSKQTTLEKEKHEKDEKIEVVHSDGDSSDSESDSKIMRQILQGSSHEDSMAEEEEHESETESMKMRRILYGSTKSNVDSHLDDSGQQIDTNNDSISSIAGPGTGTARRAIVPDTVQEMDEDQTDEGDLTPLQQSTSFSQSQSFSASFNQSHATTTSRSGSSNHSPTQSKGSFRSGNVTNSSSRTPPASPLSFHTGSTTPSSQRSGSVASKYLSQSSRSSAATPISPQQSTSQASRSIATESRRSRSSSNHPHPWNSNHTGRSNSHRSRSTHSSGSQSQRDAASEQSRSRSNDNESGTHEESKTRIVPANDPPESPSSGRNGGIDNTETNQQEPGLGNSEGDLNDSIKSKESVLHRLRERRRAKETDRSKADNPESDRVVFSPPNELARDPSGDLKSFTVEYDTQSEGDLEFISGDQEIEEREGEKNNPGMGVGTHTAKESGDKKSLTSHPSESSGSSKSKEEDTARQTMKDQPNEGSAENPTEAALVEQVETSVAPSWSPIKETKNIPYTLHKLGSHDTDDWKPPALTTYGESKYIPATRRQDEGRLDPDAKDPVSDVVEERSASPRLPLQPVKQPAEKVSNDIVDRPPFVQEELPEKIEKPKDNPKRLPVSPPPEITFVSSLEDDSSLGTNGTYLERFPTKKNKDVKKKTTLAVTPRFAREDSVAGGHEVKKAAIVPRFAQEDSVAGEHAVKKIVPRFAQGDSLAGGYEVNQKTEVDNVKVAAIVPRFAQGDSIAGAHEVKQTQGTVTDSEVSIPKYIGGDALVQEMAWTDQHLRPPTQQKDAVDDYYRSWIQGQSGRNEQSDRQDPPGNADLFPFNPKKATTDRPEEQSDSSAPPTPFNMGVNKEALHASTWVPHQEKPEVRRSDSIPSLPLYYYKSERSTNSAWGVPGMRKGRSQDDVELEARRTYIDNIMSEKRPQQTSRSASNGRSAWVDHTGTVSSSSPSKSSSSQPYSFVSGTSRSLPSRSGRSSSTKSPPSLVSRSRTSRSRTSASSQSQSFSKNGTPIPIPAPLLDAATEESEASYTVHVFDESPRPQSKPPTEPRNFEDWSESSHSVELVDETSRAVSQPVSNVLKSASKNSPESPKAQNNTSFIEINNTTKRVGPYISNRAVFAIAVALFFILAGAGVVIYFFVVPLIQEREASGATPAPTPSPTIDTSKEGLQNFISQVFPATGDKFNDNSSPQSMALSWLADNQFLNSYMTDKVLQRFAMATIYYSTGGETWDSSDLWLSDIDECDWYSSETQTDVCNGNGQLDEVDLNENGLSGPLPWNELAILKSQLLILDVFSNQVSGSLESSIGELTSLIVLDLQRNGFRGTIPQQVEDLKAMKHFILAENNFSGEIPNEIAGMMDLESLNLSGNRFQGTIPEILGSMTALRNVFLDGNNFVGTIPPALCDRDLENLVIDCGPVVCDCCTCGSGTTAPPIQNLPPAVSSPPNQSPLPAPTTSSPAAQSPSGPLQPASTPTNIKDLQNLIEGAFPESQSALQNPDTPQSRALEWLESSANYSVSTEEAYLQRYALAILYYASNGDGWSDNTAWLSSTNECSWVSTANSQDVCDEFGRYLSIDLQENNLDGSIPEELAILSNSLNTINLRANKIYGQIPVSLKDILNLETLDLSTNNLDGSIPKDLFDATNLRQLSLFENTLTSTLPSEVGQLMRLELLDVGANKLTGTLPSTLGLMSRLAGLSVFDNAFTGTLPTELANNKNLQLLYVDSNELRGPLPTDVCLLNLEEFWSDCEETQCVCCTTCCNDGFGCFET